MKSKTYILFLLLTCAFFIQAQTNSQNVNTSKNNNIWSNFTYDVESIFGGVGYVYTRPLHWKKDDFLKFGLMSSLTYGIYTADTNINRVFQKHKNDVPNILLDYGWYAGSPQNNYGLTGAVYLTGLFTKNEKLRRTGVLLISSATATGFLQQVTKSLVGRARPGAGFGKHHFKPFGGSSKYRSFPSGHSVLTFTSAHVIAKQFDSWWIKGPIYTIGLIPGLSRIYEEAHWASDVFLSWALSYFIVEGLDNYLDKRYDKKYNSQEKRNKGKLNVMFTGNTVGVSYTF